MRGETNASISGLTYLHAALNDIFDAEVVNEGKRHGDLLPGAALYGNRVCSSVINDAR